jgi:hypothetical protein
MLNNIPKISRSFLEKSVIVGNPHLYWVGKDSDSAIVKQIAEEFVSKKFDSFMYKEKLKSEASASQGVSDKFEVYLRDSLKNIDSIMNKVLKDSLFVTNPVIYRKLKISLLLKALNSLKLKKRLDSDLPTIIVWKLPKSMSGYVRVLLKEFYTELKLEILDCHKMVCVDDATLEKLICTSETIGDLAYEE